MRALMTATLIGGWALTQAAMAAPPEGAYIFDTSPKFPDFTRVVITEKGGKLTGTLTSRWYGDLPMKELRADGDKLIFQIYNGNPRVKMSDIVIVPEGKSLRMTGKIWYQDFDITARKGTRAEIKALDFPTYPLPPYRVVPQKNLAATPPMGWNSWNKFATAIDDKTVREIADAVARGARAQGRIARVRVRDRQS